MTASVAGSSDDLRIRQDEVYKIDKRCKQDGPTMSNVGKKLDGCGSLTIPIPLFTDANKISNSVQCEGRLVVNSDNELHDTFMSKLKSMSSMQLENEILHPDLLLMDSAREFNKHFTTVYAPFGQINTKAKVVIVGITPGRYQMAVALRTSHERLLSGATRDEALSSARTSANFAGPLRRNLVEMLDFVGLPEIFGIEKSIDLWGDKSNFVHFTSLLRYPVFVEGINYSGNPYPLDVRLLEGKIIKNFVSELRLIEACLIIPLGRVVESIIDFLIQSSQLSSHCVLRGLPHPSGANSERIAYFLRKKSRHELSKATFPDKIDVDRANIVDDVTKLKMKFKSA